MSSQPDSASIKKELDHLMASFFHTVSFDENETPTYNNIYTLFLEPGLLIKNTSEIPEISNTLQFIAPRQAMVNAGELTRFQEIELSEETQIFGNIAHRFSVYSKSGIMNGVQFEARGMITTQFVRTPQGWRMSSMAWDDERPGLSISERS